MSRPNALLALALAALLVTAGCLGGTTVPGADGGDGANGAHSDDASVSFYLSDRPGAIDQFEHLNVTITAVGFHQAGDADDGGDDANATASDDDDHENENVSDDGDDHENENATAETTTVEEPNETMTQQPPNVTDTEDGDDDHERTETEAEDDEHDDDGGDDAGDGGWVRHEVDNRTVDLTQLRGANASQLADFNVSSGEYDGVFVYVGDVQGTLENGEQVDVQLPSDRLHINKEFTVESGSNVSFVFDIMVHEAGNSGRYILRPVVSQSGTDDQVEIHDVDDDEHGPAEDHGQDDDEHGQSEHADDDDGDDGDHADGADLQLSADGQVRAGENVTLTVTDADGPVTNATVTVDDEVVGTTDADGHVTLAVPDDADELEVTVTKGESETEASWPVRGGGNGHDDALAV